MSQPETVQSGGDPGITGTSTRSDHAANRRMRRLLFGCAAVTVITTLAIFAILLDNATNFFFDRRLHEAMLTLSVDYRVSIVEFFTSTRWAPGHPNPSFGVLPLINGTLLITVGAAFISIPVGTLTAVYLSEYASPPMRRKLKPTLEVLAGVPTIVYGFFALSFITPVLLRPFFGLFGIRVGLFNALAGIIVVGIMTIPMVASISEDAMQAVPDDLRNGAYALGASKQEVSTGIVIPASISGIFASYILAISRAIGETMAVTMAAGYNPTMTANPLAEIQTMTARMVAQAQGESAIGTIEYQSLFAIGLVLFVMTLAANLMNDWIKRRYREEYR